jgi:hypothetical protein
VTLPRFLSPFFHPLTPPEPPGLGVFTGPMSRGCVLWETKSGWWPFSKLCYTQVGMSVIWINPNIPNGWQSQLNQYVFSWKVRPWIVAYDLVGKTFTNNYEVSLANDYVMRGLRNWNIYERLIEQKTVFQEWQCFVFLFGWTVLNIFLMENWPRALVVVICYNTSFIF